MKPYGQPFGAFEAETLRPGTAHEALCAYQISQRSWVRAANRFTDGKPLGRNQQGIDRAQIFFLERARSGLEPQAVD